MKTLARRARPDPAPPLPTTFRCAIEEFAAFLAQFLGGPPEHFQRRWWLSLHESHQRFKIGPDERAAWLKQMNATLDTEVAEPHRSMLRELFQRAAPYVANEKIQPSPSDARWNIQLLLDQAVAALRQGQPERAMERAEAAPLKDFLARNPAIFAHLLAVMLRTRNCDPAFLERALTAKPGARKSPPQLRPHSAQRSRWRRESPRGPAPPRPWSRPQ